MFLLIIKSLKNCRRVIKIRARLTVALVSGYKYMYYERMIRTGNAQCTSMNSAGIRTSAKTTLKGTPIHIEMFHLTNVARHRINCNTHNCDFEVFKCWWRPLIKTDRQVLIVLISWETVSMCQ